MDIKCECSHCGQHFILDETAVGQQFECPNCKQTITVRPSAGIVLPVPTNKIKGGLGAAIGGWVCFGIGVVVLFIPLPTWFIYAPLFFVSFILGIVAMAQGRIANGLTLLLFNIIGVPVLYVVAILFGLATWGAIGLGAAVMNQASNATPPAQTTSALKTNSVTVITPTFATIEGAFGAKLGDEYDTNSAINMSTEADGTSTYEFNPANAFRSFSHYYVKITPATHKIYGILASEDFADEDSAQKEQVLVMKMLKDQYGPEEDQNPADAKGNVERIVQGNRYIMTREVSSLGARLGIGYYDKDLQKLAGQEQTAN
jgi:hypothetical protein